MHSFKLNETTLNFNEIFECFFQGNKRPAYMKVEVMMITDKDV